MQIYYLEIVKKEVSAASEAKFGKPDAGLGNARTATLAGDGLVGVGEPIHDEIGQLVDALTKVVI